MKIRRMLLRLVDVDSGPPVCYAGREGHEISATISRSFLPEQTHCPIEIAAK